jgi:hypothetical protein
MAITSFIVLGFNFFNQLFIQSDSNWNIPEVFHLAKISTNVSLSSKKG